MEDEELETLAVSNALAILTEHFETVQIFCSRYVDGETYTTDTGYGNIHAIRGQVEAWLSDVDEEED